MSAAAVEAVRPGFRVEFPFASLPAAPPTTVAGEDLSEDELRDRLASTEAELHRLQRRRAVRWVDAVRRAQRAGSLREAAGALRELRR